MQKKKKVLWGFKDVVAPRCRMSSSQKLSNHESKACNGLNEVREDLAYSDARTLALITVEGSQSYKSW